MTRSDRREQNRAAVLRAARAQFEEHGFHEASLDAIAEAAGFSKGVVYSRFGSKDELFLALLEENIDRRDEMTAQLLADLSGPEDMPRLAAMAIGENVASAAWQAALLEFRAHAWRRPQVNRRYQELHERTIEKVSGAFAALYDRSGQRPAHDPHLMAVAALAAGTGVLAEYMADPRVDVRALAEVLAPTSIPAPLTHEGAPT